MGRPTKKQTFLRMLFDDIEEEGWEEYQIALYKEEIIDLKTHKGRPFYDYLMSQASSWWDIQVEIDPKVQPEEILTEMGDVLDTPVTRKFIFQLDPVSVL